MLTFSILVIVLIAIAASCDFTPYTLTNEEITLLYNNEDKEEPENTNVFGDSSVTGKINETDLVNSSAQQQAEELLNKIYNG